MLEVVQQGSRRAKPAPGSLAKTALARSLRAREERSALESAALPARSIKANTDLIREGEAVDQLFVVTQGWACRYKTTRDGGRQIVALLLPGDMANLDTLAFDQPGYGVRFLCEGKVVPIPRERIVALTSEYDGIGGALTRLAMVENAILSQWALCLGRQSAQERLAHLLCELAVRADGDDDGASSSFELPLTQEQLADTLGLTAVHVNRTMQHFRNAGLIVTAGRAITLSDVPRLRLMAGFKPSYLHLATDERCALQGQSEDGGQGLSPFAAL